MSKIVIIGNSAAGFGACECLLKEASGNEITVISKEDFPAYKRNLLLDYFLGAVKEGELFLCGEDFYKKNNIVLMKNAEVERLDIKRKRVVFKDNTRIDYDYLIIASGQTVGLPGIPGIKKDGVFSFYDIQSLKQIMLRLVISNTVCLLGDNNINLRLAEFISGKGKEVKIICCSGTLGAYTPKDGVEVINNSGPQEIIGEGEVKALKLTNGKIFGANMVVFSANYSASSDFIGETSINTQEGYILVDENLRTNIENVFAAGSICKSYNFSSKSWNDAVSEGIAAARGIIKKTKGE